MNPTRHKLSGRIRGNINYRTSGINIFPDRIIHTAAKKTAKQLSLKIAKQIKDKYGTYAYLLERDGQEYVLVAKRRIAILNNQPAISIRKDLVKGCIRINAHILVYIESTDTIYKVDPKKISDNLLFENRHNGAVMLNFAIKGIAKNMSKKNSRGNSKLDKWV
jgi:hypothetical protein